MTARILAPALAAVLASAAPALAFHPFSHGCGSHPHHSAQPVAFHAVAAPMSFHTVAAPMSFHTVAAPMSFHTVAAPMNFQTFSLVANPGDARGADALALREAGSILALLKGVCAVVNPRSGTTGDAADLKQIQADLDLIKEKLQITPKKSTPKSADDKGDGRMESGSDDARATPRVSERLARIDTGLDELEAIQRRTDAMRSAAARPRTTTPTETPAITRR